MNFSKARSYQHASLWLGAVLVGGTAVLYARIVNVAQEWFLSRFATNPYLSVALAPFAFLVAAALVRKIAPDAKGSGIPQVLEAIEAGASTPNSNEPWHSPLVSLKTAVVKVISSIVGIVGGASIGREGPTIQIAASVFAAVGRRVRRHAPQIELPSYLTAGAAAGIAAAFNTPVAGITFAIEEVVNGALGSLRQTMMLSVILSGITAQALAGDYLYFGHPTISAPDWRVIYQSVLIGLVGGGLGGGFARVLAFPRLTRLPKHWMIRALLCGSVCSALCLLTGGETAGSGYEATQKVLVAASADGANLYFPLFKLATTAFSYLSGIAGGIFSPSLSIGAGIGISLAKLLSFPNFRTCALMGMVAFFSGVVQAPITAVIIVTEMTDQHVLILPFMVAAFLAQGVGRLLMPTPLYHFLAKRHQEG